MRFSLILFIIAFQTALSQAQPEELRWHPLPAPTRSAINEAFLLNEKLGYILTSEGFVFRYENGRWEQLSLPENTSLRTICVIADKKIWASGYVEKSYRQKMFYYEHGSWRKVPCPNVDDIRTIAFEDSAHGWAGGVWGEMLRYQNGMWQSVYSPTRLHVTKILFDPQGGKYAITEHRRRGQVLRWDGEKWQIWLEENLGELHCAYAFSENDLWLMSNSRVLLHWNGKTLEPVLRSERFSYHFTFVDKNNGIFPTPQNLITYGGKNFHSQALPASNAFFGVVSSPDGHLWLYGNSGTIWASGGNPPDSTLRSQPFTRDRIALGKMKGAAFFEIRPGQPAIYAVEHEKPNLILLPRENGAFRLNLHSSLPAKEFGLDEPQQTWQNEAIYDHAALAADFNNDGFDDIFLSSLYGENCLFLNSGRGQFLNATQWASLAHHPGRYGFPATADVDNDGDLDLFVPDEMGRSKLYFNDSYGRFRDATTASNAIVPLGAKAAAFADIDLDGWIDLAVTTYGEGTFLFRNLGNGRFEDITAFSPELQKRRLEKCTALAFADYDNDGDLDLFISKLLASNALLQNDGAGRFRDVTHIAGLTDSSLTRGAVFFDIDNDGDLDLYLTNMGPDVFYRNAGNGVFLPDMSLFNNFDWSWQPKENAIKRYGEYSTGAVVFDNHNDGDLELLVLSFDSKSSLFINWQRNNNFITLKLTGVHSNRSAIGATATLYPAGKSGNSQAVLGTRFIESSSGYGSHAQKLIHFGVDEKRKYSVEIRFPGSRTISLHDVQPGTTYEIKDADDAQASQVHFQKKLSNLIFGHRSLQRYLQLGLFLLLAIFLIVYFRRYLWWESLASLWLIIVLATGLSLSHLMHVYKSNWFFVSIPLLISTFFGILFIGIWRWWRIYQSPHASISALSMKLAAFDHSTPLANLILSLNMQLQNMPIESEIESVYAKRCLQTIKKVREEIGAEIQVIVGYQYAISFEKARSAELSRCWRRLGRYLKRLESCLILQTTPKAAILAQAKDDLRAVRQHLQKLRKIISTYETADVMKTIDSVLENFESTDIEILWAPRQVVPLAHMPPNELRMIVTEIIANAERAMANSSHKLLEIRVSFKQRIYIDFTDCGRGIPEENRERIFARSYSTRSRGGLGMYYAKQILECYRGEIFVKDSAIGKGTTFRIILENARAQQNEQIKTAQETDPAN